MNSLHYLIITFCFAIGLATAETRTFTSADGTRSFQGTFIGYNSETQVAAVRNAQGQPIHFNIDLVSAKDQEFIKTAVPQERIKLDVRFETNTDRKSADRSRGTHTQTHDGGYSIRLNNYTPADLKNVEVEYILVYRKDSVNARREDQTLRGSGTVDIPANGDVSFDTSKVELVSFFKAGEVRRTGCCGNARVNTTAAQRSRDSLAGCIARIKLNGEVIAIDATSPAILSKYEDELSGSH